jgi:hypothetical protein
MPEHCGGYFAPLRRELAQDVAKQDMAKQEMAK